MIKKIPIVVLCLLLVLAFLGCSTNADDLNAKEQSTDIDTKSEINDTIPTNDNYNFLSLAEAEEKVKKLISFGIILLPEFDGTDNSIKIETTEDENDYNIKLSVGSYTMDKETGIIYCVEENKQLVCNNGYLAYVDGGIIIDSKELSCIPAEAKASADDTGIQCTTAVINKYIELKSLLLEKNSN